MLFALFSALQSEQYSAHFYPKIYCLLLRFSLEELSLF